MRHLGCQPNPLCELSLWLDGDADRIQGLAAVLSASLQAGGWAGPDQEEFLTDWRSRHLPQLLRSATLLRMGAERVRASSQQQQLISEI